MAEMRVEIRLEEGPFEFLLGLALDLYEMEMEQAAEQLLRAAFRSLAWSIGDSAPQPVFDEQGIEAAVSEIFG